MNNRHIAQLINCSLMMTAVLAVVMYLTPPARAAGAEKTLVCLDLGGAWQVAQKGKSDWIPATVPGNVHTDLLKAGKIPDPFYRDNDKDKKVSSVSDANWVYKRSFEVSQELLQHEKILLRCEGLDTLATLKINGKEIGHADNMFRTWEFDVKSVLRLGSNDVEITFDSPLPYIKQKKVNQPLMIHNAAWVRKTPCQFGWDFAPTLVTCGIWNNIELLAFDVARLTDPLIIQDHSQKGRVDLEVQIAAENTRAAKLHAVVTVRQGQNEVGVKEVDLTDGKGSGTLSITSPKLWWPNGMGEHPLYTVETRLLDAKGTELDRITKRIGLRTMKMVPGDTKTNIPLHFEVNGVPFFGKGANCVPFDSFNSRVTPEILRRYVSDAASVNMNMLRLWGGAYYERDEFFDACDEMGICIWLDFKFACSGYPSFDPAFLENVRMEARDQLRRLRHHPSIALWCGNNEISYHIRDAWSDNGIPRGEYYKLFKDVLGGEVKELNPQADYVTGSPECGDTHYWKVWHGLKNHLDDLSDRQPVEEYRNQSGFMSEFGMQAYPVPMTVESYTDKSDRESVTTEIMRHHNNGDARKAAEVIKKYVSDSFKAPKDFDSNLWLSQINQAHAIKVGAEYWRATMPKSMGCVFWQYNDCWPTASWAAVDFYGRWKALLYAARHFFEPLLVSGVEKPTESAVDVYVTSDRMEACHGKVTWTATDVSGTVLEQGSQELDIPERKAQKICTVDLKKHCQSLGAQGVLTWLKLEVGGITVSENLVFLSPPKNIDLQDPKIHCEVTESKDGFLVTLTAQKPALWAWVTLIDKDARYSDNFIHLFPGATKQILVKPAQPMTLAEIKERLRVQSLFDTYAHQ
jgi:beta-mannosidase